MNIEESRLDEVIKFLNEKFGGPIQAFNTRNWIGDDMVTIYEKDGIQIDYAPDYDYIEIFGVSEEEFEILKNQMWR